MYLLYLLIFTCIYTDPIYIGMNSILRREHGCCVLACRGSLGVIICDKEKMVLESKKDDSSKNVIFKGKKSKPCSLKPKTKQKCWAFPYFCRHNFPVLEHEIPGISQCYSTAAVWGA